MAVAPVVVSHTSIFEKSQGTEFYISDIAMTTIPADVDAAVPSSTPTYKWIPGACATNEISYQGGQKTDIDVTALCSDSQEVTNGLAAPAEVTLSRNWAGDEPMLAELEKADDNDEVRLYKVIFPSGNGFAFLAEIRQNSWSVATAGKVSASYTLRLRGKPHRIKAVKP